MIPVTFELSQASRAASSCMGRGWPGSMFTRAPAWAGWRSKYGAGKSTTVLMLTTLLPPTSGTARVGGFDVVHQGSQVRASIGAALQEAALDPILTGREHVNLQATLQGLAKADRRVRAGELLAR